MLPKQNILNFTMTVFVKILVVQEALSLGVIWLNTVFLWILVNKHSVNISSKGNTQLILYAVNILKNSMLIDVSQQ